VKNSHQKEIWGKVWESNLEKIDELIEECDPRVVEALEFANSGFRIIDAGCGLGQVVFNILRRGYDAYGIDYDVNTIKSAKRVASMKNIDGKERFINGDIVNLPFADNSFDMYLSYGVIEHFTKAQHLKIMGEARRVVKDGGVVFVYYPNIHSLFGIQSYILSRLGIRHIWQIPLSLSYVEHLMTRFRIRVMHSYSCKFASGIYRNFHLGRKFFKDFIPNPFYFAGDGIMRCASSHEDELAKYGHINITIGVNQKTEAF